jgi:hypothetical protein
MQAQAHLDPRLVPLFLTEAGVAADAVLEIRGALAALLSAKIMRRAKPSSCITRARRCVRPERRGRRDRPSTATSISAALTRFTNPFDPANRALQSDTVNTLMDLDASLRRAGGR